jgi:hypothetical protein
MKLFPFHLADTHVHKEALTQKAAYTPVHTQVGSGDYGAASCIVVKKIASRARMQLGGRALA